jgi:hypothetical protein
MVFAVQCPNPKCRKYQLVEDHERGKVVHCLLCKTAIRTAAPRPSDKGQAQPPSNPPRKP